jgi:predicted ester cyclase
LTICSLPGTRGQPDGRRRARTTVLCLGIPATGKRVHFVGCSVYRFLDGKIVEQWEYGDVLGLLQQLGVIPPLG